MIKRPSFPTERATDLSLGRRFDHHAVVIAIGLAILVAVALLGRYVPVSDAQFDPGNTLVPP